MSTSLRATAVLVAALLLAACGGDDSEEPAEGTTTSPPTSEVTTSTAEAPGDEFEVPETPLRAPLNTTYPQGTFDAERFGVEPGSVTAAWYASGDRWAVHYDGLTSETASGKCPGNSIQTGAGFQHISNSPYGALACSGLEDRETYVGTVLPPGSLFLCGESAVVYVTEIPLTAEGTLFGSLEQVLDDGSVQGITSTVTADADQAPEIDLDDPLCGAVS